MNILAGCMFESKEMLEVFMFLSIACLSFFELIVFLCCAWLIFSSEHFYVRDNHEHPSGRGVGPKV